MISRIDPRKQTDSIYSVRFGNTELIARNSRDFARIAVFARWYMRTCSTPSPLQCSLKRELPSQALESAATPEAKAVKEPPYLRLKSWLSTFVNRQVQLKEKQV